MWVPEKRPIGIPEDVDDDMAYNLFKVGGEVVISKDVEGGVDLCPHDWIEVEEKREIGRALGCIVYRCRRLGCLRFVFQHRTALHKFLWSYKSFPKIPCKLPERGYYSLEWFSKRFGMHPKQIYDYFQLVEGLDIDGFPAYIKTDNGRVFFYRDDPSPCQNITSLKHMANHTLEGTEAKSIEHAATHPTDYSRARFGNQLRAYIGTLGPLLTGFFLLLAATNLQHHVNKSEKYVQPDGCYLNSAVTKFNERGPLKKFLF
ncbi:MAG: hypothetical protein QXN87_08905, partial [Candidatus Bathyarchaeia archaeon]